jgi:hypothetical protein
MDRPGERVLLVDPDSGLALDWWTVPTGVWRRRETGEYAEFEPPRGFFDYVVTSFEWDDDAETLSVEGCNPEVSNPTSIIARNGMLRETYQDLQHDRAELDELRATLESRALSIDRLAVNDLLEAVEHSARFGGSAWEEIQGSEWGQDLRPDADERDRADPEPPEEDDRPTLGDMVDTATGADAGGSREVSADD